MSNSAQLRPYRNRHGRGLRGVVLPQQTPRFRSRSQQFDMAALDAFSSIHAAFAPQLESLDLAVDTVPRMNLGSDLALIDDEIFSDGPVPLGRVLQPGIDTQGQPTRARIVLFRKPIEQRAATSEQRQQLLQEILTVLVATYLNLDPHDVDARYPWGD